MGDKQWVPLRTRGAVTRWLMEHPGQALSAPDEDVYAWFDDAGVVRIDRLGRPHECCILSCDEYLFERWVPMVNEVEESDG